MFIESVEVGALSLCVQRTPRTIDKAASEISYGNSLNLVKERMLPFIPLLSTGVGPRDMNCIHACETTGGILLDNQVRTVTLTTINIFHFTISLMTYCDMISLMKYFYVFI